MVGGWWLVVDVDLGVVSWPGSSPRDGNAHEWPRRSLLAAMSVDNLAHGHFGSKPQCRGWAMPLADGRGTPLRRVSHQLPFTS